jgi:hypothetical protein
MSKSKPKRILTKKIRRALNGSTKIPTRATGHSQAHVGYGKGLTSRSFGKQNMRTDQNDDAGE